MCSSELKRSLFEVEDVKTEGDSVSEAEKQEFLTPQKTQKLISQSSASGGSLFLLLAQLLTMINDFASLAPEIHY